MLPLGSGRQRRSTTVRRAAHARRPASQSRGTTDASTTARSSQPSVARLLLEDPLLRRELVEELLVLAAVVELLLVLGHLRLDLRDLRVELLDLLHLLLLRLGLRLRLLHRRLGILRVVLEELLEAHLVLLQHLLALLQRLLTLLRPLLQLADLRALRVERHLHEEHLAFLRDEVGHVLLLLSSVARRSGHKIHLRLLYRLRLRLVAPMRAVVAHASGHRRHALLPDVLPSYLLALQLLAVLLLVTQREHLLVGGHAEGVWTITHGPPRQPKWASGTDAKVLV